MIEVANKVTSILSCHYDKCIFTKGIKDYAARGRRIIPHERSGKVCRYVYGI